MKRKLVTLLFSFLVFNGKIADVLSHKDYQFTGFLKHASIPVSFPRDICIFEIDKTNFAASLHTRGDGQLEFVVFKQKNGSYIQIYERPTQQAVNMDCISRGRSAYIALAYQFSEPVDDVRHGAPIFEITINDISVVQFFPTPYQSVVYLRNYGPNLYLLQTLGRSNSENIQCPIYEWSGYHFNYVNYIPCDNATGIEAFTVNDEAYVLVANKQSLNALDNNKSILYKYRPESQKFLEHQEFKASVLGAQMKYFVIKNKHRVKEHFLILATEQTINDLPASKGLGTPVVIYKYKNGIFVPFQQLYFHNVTHFLPIHKQWQKFILLVGCANQEVKYLRYDGRSFVLSNVQLTSGSLGQGVVAMRTFEDRNDTYVVISNERMATNDTNIYLPRYKELEDRKNVKKDLLERFQNLYKKLTSEHTNMQRIQALIENFSKGVGYFKNVNISEIRTKMVISPKYNFTHEYWKKLAIATKSIAKLEQKLLSLSPPSTTQNDTDNFCTYDYLELDTLNITNRLEVANINNKSLNSLNFDKIVADKIVVEGKLNIKKTIQDAEEFLTSDHTNRTRRDTDFQEIHAKEIIISGTINGINFNDFSNRILKKRGNQILTAPFRFHKVNANEVEVSAAINNESPSKLISISGGSYVIDQDLIFEEPLYVQQLVINDRLNHINVVQGKLEVLLKNSSEVQMIGGRKTFENVHLLEPFVLRGKIHSPQLDKINPVATILKNLTLEGDYEITGQVFVANKLVGSNFYGERSTRNLLEVFENGLSINTENIYQKMDFKHAIKAENVKTNFLNEYNIIDFVTKHAMDQVITGTKTFTGNLHIKGSCEVENINGVNLKELNENRLQKYGDQIITGNLQFNGVNVESVSSISNVMLGDANIENILTTSTLQNASQVTIENLHVGYVKVNQMSGTKKIFGENLDFIMNDTLLTDSLANITGFKNFTGDFSTHELILNGKLNQHPINELIHSFGNLTQDIVIDHDVVFENDIEIDSLSFEGEINGILASKFGSSWLTNEGDQTFTAPQDFDEITAQNVFVEKLINNKNLSEIFSQIIWLDEKQFLQNVTFAKIIAEDDLSVHGKINGMNFAESVLLKKSSEIQNIEAPVTCNGDIRVSGKLTELNSFNNIDLIKLQAILTGQSENAKLTVDSAIFEKSPQFRLLNGRDFNDVLNNVWLSNQDAVIKGSMMFNDVHLNSHVELNGPVNGVDLQYLKENYFSLTKDQRVLTPFVFKKPVIFEETFSSEQLTLEGYLVDTLSKRSFNFSDLAVKNLRTDIDQEITGQWNISHVVIEGDLNNVLINGQNLVNDVLRHDVTSLQEIKAPKKFNKVTITNMEFSARARINDIDVVDWIHNSVLIYGNFTIQGTTTIDDLIVYDDVTAVGTVNDIKFDEKHLILVDTNQTIFGNVTIRTKFEKMNKILPLSVEHLHVKKINNIHVDVFFENIVPYKDELQIDGNVIFQKPVNVNKLHTSYDLFNLNHISENSTDYVSRVLEDYEHLERSFQVKARFLSHYVFKENSIKDEVQKIVHIKVPPVFAAAEDIIAVLRGESDVNVTFHKWNEDMDFFDLSNEFFSWSANDSTIVDCEKITIYGADILVIETFSESMYTKHFLASTTGGMKVMYQMSSHQSELITPIVYKEQQCFLSYTSYYNDLKLQCMELSQNGKVNLTTARVIQTEDVVFQVLPLKAAEFFVTTPNAVQIWNLNLLTVPVAVISIKNPNVITCGTFDNYDYIAVSVSGRNILIYRAFNGSTYNHFQTMEAYNIIDMKFSKVLPSQDFLLYVLTTDQKQSLTGYAFRGIIGFQKFFNPINLKPARRFDLMSIKESTKYFISYEASNEVVFMEAVIPSA